MREGRLGQREERGAFHKGRERYVLGAGKLERRKEARLAKEEEIEFLQKKIFYFFFGRSFEP